MLIMATVLGAAIFLTPEKEEPTEEIVVYEEDETLSCNDWLGENSSLEYKRHGCTEHTDILESVEENGGSVIPLSDDRFFIFWAPEGWFESEDKKLVLTVHGGGGCAETVFELWNDLSEDHDYAIIALQTAEKGQGAEEFIKEEHYSFDSPETMYELIKETVSELGLYCDLDNTDIIYHGFSRGSAVSYEVALTDYGEDGEQIFSAYIADSGGLPVELAEYLEKSQDSFNGVHFWLYCSENDQDGDRCEGMKFSEEILTQYGAVVDEFYINPIGGHGLISLTHTRAESSAFDKLFNYIDALSP